MNESIEITAPAKVNLYLEVLGKRPDGFHDIESIFQAISIFDVLTVKRVTTAGVRIRCSRKDLETSDNLAARAACAFAGEIGLEGGVEIDLVKRIPVQGGLGGGSSDAAAVLVALNELAGGPLDSDGLRRMGAALGSDVPFFVEGGTAIVTGRGERVEPVTPAADYWFVVFYPGFGISTAEVYKNLRLKLTEKENCANLLASLLERGLLEAGKERFFNRLEATAYGLNQRLLEARSVMQRCVGDAGIVLCGSGASMFSAFVDKDRAYQAYRVLTGMGQGEVFLAQSVRGKCSTGSAKGASRGDFRSQGQVDG